MSSSRRPEAPLALVVLPDFLEEGWPSMDVCAEMLLARLAGSAVTASRLCPPFRRRLGRLPWGGRLAFNADRFLNRHHDYPRFLRRRAADLDYFHIVDHSYAHLAHTLPQNRAGVYCHDLDCFRCLLEPERDRQPRWFRRMTRSKLDGLRQAAVVFHATRAMREQIEMHELVDPNRLVQAPYGVCPEFIPEDNETQRPRSNPQGPFLLHVGSCIPRKRIDVLLEVFAAVRARRPDLHLVQAGGEWTPAQAEQVRRLGLANVVVQRRGLARSELADLYRRAAVLLLTSEAEWFGLPLIEALACGCAVVASDLPVLREVGGQAALYAPVGDVPAWAQVVGGVLEGSVPVADRGTRLAHAARYSWEAHAATIAAAYLRLARGLPAGTEVSCASPS